MNSNPENEGTRPHPDDENEASRSDAESARSEAARQMGRSRSPRKGEAARLNGSKGGRPRGQKTDAATRERMKAAQQKRREQEQSDPHQP